ncbi:MAG: VapC toxin family PIN domain ribonuclease [Deltaproteobacteria bacterium]|nr:MAG: VapC toxin family PIN domain ribonuclease [Deltaproteobacteria bacterium]
MILVDSSVWIAYFNNSNVWQVDFLDFLLGREPIVIGDLIISEVLQGFRRNKDFETAKELLSSLEICEMGGYDNAVKSAENYRILRKTGITVRKTIDVIIGTYCIENDLQLLHDDRDFVPMEEILYLKCCKSEYFN